MEDLPEVQREEVWELSPTQLRDRLLSLNPLDAAWVARINQVHAASTLYKSVYRHMLITSHHGHTCRRRHVGIFSPCLQHDLCSYNIVPFYGLAED